MHEVKAHAPDIMCRQMGGEIWIPLLHCQQRCPDLIKCLVTSLGVQLPQMNTRRTGRLQHDTAWRRLSEPSDPVIRATQKVKGIADCPGDGLSGDDGGTEEYGSCVASAAATRVCHPPPSDVSMLMQNVPCGAGKGPSPADLQNELLVHDTFRGLTDARSRTDGEEYLQASVCHGVTGHLMGHVSIVRGEGGEMAGLALCGMEQTKGLGEAGHCAFGQGAPAAYSLCRRASRQLSQLAKPERWRKERGDSEAKEKDGWREDHLGPAADCLLGGSLSACVAKSETGSGAFTGSSWCRVQAVPNKARCLGGGGDAPGPVLGLHPSSLEKKKTPRRKMKFFVKD
ncbi:unnamed protein product [Pleuronectes platessa]|uniref:Uncharacterized protein n=1 Tax=Pleuronectes platessa TaxID=8262 RepID=A0A9N7UE92_PLEPL|nr:unnamed protein product [Pleuronectes platessa]